MVFRITYNNITIQPPAGDSEKRRDEGALARKGQRPPASGLQTGTRHLNPLPKMITHAHPRAMDGAVSIAIRRRRIDGVCLRQTPMPKSGRTPDFGTRKGLEGCGADPARSAGAGAIAEPRKARSRAVLPCGQVGPGCAQNRNNNKNSVHLSRPFPPAALNSGGFWVIIKKEVFSA
jgi:hypothetical protein